MLDITRQTAETAKEVTEVLQQKLKDKDEHLKSTLRSVSDAIICCDEKGNIEGVNNATLNIFGHTKEYWQTKNITDLFVYPNSNINEISTKELWSILDQESLWENNNFDDKPIDSLFGLINGKHHRIDISVTKVARNNSFFYMFIIRDLEKFETTKKQLNDTKHQYNNIFFNSFDGIIIVQNQKIVAANPVIEKLLGISKDAIINQNILNFVHSDDWMKLYKISLSSQSKKSIRALKENKEILHVQISASKIFWNNNDAHLILVKDLTMIEQLENQVEIANDKLNDYVNEAPDMICVLDKNFVIKYANNLFVDHWLKNNEEKSIDDIIENITNELKKLDTHNPIKRFNKTLTTINNETFVVDIICKMIANDDVEYHIIMRDISYLLQ